MQQMHNYAVLQLLHRSGPCSHKSLKVIEFPIHMFPSASVLVFHARQTEGPDTTMLPIMGNSRLFAFLLPLAAAQVLLPPGLPSCAVSPFVSRKSVPNKLQKVPLWKHHCIACCCVLR
jgi:hypothetical protein